MEIYKEVGLPDRGRRALRPCQHDRHARHRPYPHGDRVRRHDARRASVLDRPDECLVHNGSLSNHNDVRRELVRDGMSFETENDTEVAAAYLTWRMREGDTSARRWRRPRGSRRLLHLRGRHRDGFAVMRDPIACKPAVMAETDDYVAFGSEYRALVALPGIENARVWEPEPATVYAWERH